MPKCTILCGISGSGKSTYAKEYLPQATVCSADLFFTVDGKYRFNPAKLPDAHAYCLRAFVFAIQSKTYDVVVDNTNTTVAEIAPYAALALAYGYDLEVIRINCPVVRAYNRNTHEVPLEVIKAQAKRLESLELPPWWPMKTIG